MTQNLVVERRNADNYKNSLEQSNPEWGIAMDRVKILKRKISDLEGANLKLTETNAALMEINERLTDECAVKNGELQSLNEPSVWTQQEVAEWKEALTRKGQ